MKRSFLIVCLIVVLSFVCACTDKTQTPIIEFDIKKEFELVGSFSEGLARVKVDGKFSYIDKQGATLINIDTDECGDFVGGFAWYKKNGNGGYINKSGEKIGQEVENFAIARAYNFSEDLALVTSTGGYGTNSYFIGKDGTKNSIIEELQQSGGYSSFSNGLCMYKPMQGSLWGYKDKNNNVVITPAYTNASEYSENAAKVQINNTSNVQFIDKSGTVVFVTNSKDFLNIGSLMGGNIKYSANDKFGFLDSTGNIALAIENDYAEDFLDGNTMVKKNGEYIALDSAFAELDKFTAQDAFNAGSGVIAFKQGDKWGYRKVSGEIIIQPKYESALEVSEGYAGVRLNQKWGFIKIN